MRAIETRAIHWPTTEGNAFRQLELPSLGATEVTANNDANLTVGFWATRPARTSVVIAGLRAFSSPPTIPMPSSPSDDQPLGVNEHTAISFYNDAKGNAHPVRVQHRRRRLPRDSVSGGGTSVTAAAINNGGDMAGFETAKGGATVGWVKLSNGKTWQLKVPGASATMATGINDGDIVDGVYMVGTGNSATSLDSSGATDSASPASPIRREPARRRSTASTTTVAWSGSTPTRRATPTGSWLPRSTSAILGVGSAHAPTPPAPHAGPGRWRMPTGNINVSAPPPAAPPPRAARRPTRGGRRPRSSWPGRPRAAGRSGRSAPRGT